MDHTPVNLQIHRHTRHAQPVGVQHALVGQRIALGQADPGGRHAVEIADFAAPVHAIERRETPVVAVGGAPQVVTEEIVDVWRLQQKAVGEGLVGGGVLVPCCARIKQQLQRQRPASVARGNRGHGGQRAASAVAAQRDARRVQPQAGGVFAQPGQAVPGIHHRGRKFRCGGQPVIDRHHRAVRQVRQVPTQRLVGGHAADGEATAMKVQQHRQGRIGRWSKQPRAEFDAVARGHAQVFYARQLVGWDVEHASTSLVGQLGLRRREHVHRRVASAGDAVEHTAHGWGQEGSGIGVVRHDRNLHGAASQLAPLWLFFDGHLLRLFNTLTEDHDHHAFRLVPQSS